MPVPNLNDSQLDWVVQQVAEYIQNQRQSYQGNASPIDKNQKAIMAPFFPESILNSTRVAVLTGEQLSNPSLYGQLVAMGFEASLLPNFSEMAAITFVDTIVFHQTIQNRTLFHELVHVVQYERLGLAEFAARYVNGFLKGGSYETIPLERNAYELDARFAAAPAKALSVEMEVQSWIDRQV